MGRFFGRGNLQLKAFRRNSYGLRLGPEIQPNWDMSSGVDGWAVSGGTSIMATTYNGENVVKIEQSIDGNFKFGNLAISGLETTKNYRVVVRAARGEQGSLQTAGEFSYAANSLTNIDSTEFKNYSFDVTATANSGNTKVYCSVSGGLSGDSVYVSEVSIREILNNG